VGEGGDEAGPSEPHKKRKTTGGSRKGKHTQGQDTQPLLRQGGRWTVEVGPGKEHAQRATRVLEYRTGCGADHVQPVICGLDMGRAKPATACARVARVQDVTAPQRAPHVTRGCGRGPWHRAGRVDSVCVALSRPQVQRETQYLRTRQAREAYLRGVPGLPIAQEELSAAVRAWVCIRGSGPCMEVSGSQFCRSRAVHHRCSPAVHHGTANQTMCVTRFLPHSGHADLMHTCAANCRLTDAERGAGC